MSNIYENIIRSDIDKRLVHIHSDYSKECSLNNIIDFIKIIIKNAKEISTTDDMYVHIDFLENYNTNEVKTDNNITDIFVDLSQYYAFGRYNGELILNGGVSKGSLGVPCHVGCAKDTNAWIVLDDLVSQFLKRISRMLTPITYIVIVLGKIEILEAEDKCYTTFHYFIHHIKHS